MRLQATFEGPEGRQSVATSVRAWLLAITSTSTEGAALLVPQMYRSSYSISCFSTSVR
jgi:hypothetical protein